MSFETRSFTLLLFIRLVCLGLGVFMLSALGLILAGHPVQAILVASVGVGLYEGGRWLLLRR